MADLDVIQAKIEAGQALNEEERLEVMGETLDGETGGHDDSETDKEKSESEESTKEAATEPAPVETAKADAKAEPAKEPAQKEEAVVTPEDKKPAEASQESLDRVKEQLDQPEGKQDLSDLNERERSLFYELRHERRRRQELQRDVDTMKFNELKEKQAKDPDIEDDDFPTHKQTKKTVQREVANIETRMRTHLIGVWHREGSRLNKDFDIVLNAGRELIDGNKEYQDKIREAYDAGDNPAMVTYDLIKTDPKFQALIAKQGLVIQDGVVSIPKKEETPKDKAPELKPDAIKNAQKVQDNAAKTRTSGAVGGGEASDAGEWTLEKVSAMSDSEFRKLPTNVRQQIIQKLGM